jgi:collagen triple helix repeat protein
LHGSVDERARGSCGACGGTGTVAPSGQDGADGAPGHDGASGAPGHDGATGAPGAKGDPGAPGPKGDTGPRGPAGKAIRLYCRKVTVRVRSHGKLQRVRRTRCTTKPAGGGNPVIGGGEARATVLRGAKVLARGTATRHALTLDRRVRPGRYVLRTTRKGRTTLRSVRIA